MGVHAAGQAWQARVLSEGRGINNFAWGRWLHGWHHWRITDADTDAAGADAADTANSDTANSDATTTAATAN